MIVSDLLLLTRGIFFEKSWFSCLFVALAQDRTAEFGVRKSRELSCKVLLNLFLVPVFPFRHAPANITIFPWLTLIFFAIKAALLVARVFLQTFLLDQFLFCSHKLCCRIFRWILLVFLGTQLEHLDIELLMHDHDLLILISVCSIQGHLHGSDQFDFLHLRILFYELFTFTLSVLLVVFAAPFVTLTFQVIAEATIVTPVTLTVRWVTSYGLLGALFNDRVQWFSWRLLVPLLFIILDLKIWINLLLMIVRSCIVLLHELMCTHLNSFDQTWTFLDLIQSLELLRRYLNVAAFLLHLLDSLLDTLDIAFLQKLAQIDLLLAVLLLLVTILEQWVTGFILDICLTTICVAAHLASFINRADAPIAAHNTAVGASTGLVIILRGCSWQLLVTLQPF